MLFVGQVARGMKDREGFQEVDFKAMFAPLAKWAAEIDDPRRIPEYVHRAFQTAMAGRPGPVVLSLPEDMLKQKVEEECEPGLPALPIGGAPDAGRLERLAGYMSQAGKPMVIVGGGGWSGQAGQDVMAFAERFGAAVATSLRCQDYVANSHPNYAGHLAVGAEPSLAAHVREANLLVVLGARLGEMTTAGYRLVQPPRPRQKLVHIHPDPEELGHVYQADLPINACSAEMAKALAGLAPREAAKQKWVRACRADFVASLQVPQSDLPLDMAAAVSKIRQRMPADTIVATGAGNYTGWVHKYWPFDTFRSQLSPTSGAMGYGVPAAVAAKLTAPHRAVVAFAGDGCFLMNGQELATAMQYEAKILFVVVNNGMYGTIRMHQEREFPARVYGTTLRNPDFAALARAYGLRAERVENIAALDAALDRALEAPCSALLELVVDPEAISVRTTIPALRKAST